MNESLVKTYFSEKVLTSSFYKELNSKVESFCSNRVNELTDINFCTNDELENILPILKEEHFLISIKHEETLFDTVSSLTLNDRTLIITPDDIQNIDSLYSLINETKKLNKKEIVSNKIILSNDFLNSFEFQNSAESQTDKYYINAFLEINKSMIKALKYFNSYLQDKNKKISFNLITHDYEINSKESLLFKFSDSCLIEVLTDQVDEYKDLIVVTLETLKTYYSNNGLEGKKKAESYWEDIFAKFPIPMAIMTEKGQLLYHNSLFTQLELLPKKCMEYSDNQKVEINGNFYICVKENIEVNTESLVFFQFLGVSNLEKTKEMDAKPTFKELGIVSSSIAHELNNPLAGILSAVEVLELIDAGGSELNDIKKAAKRCKELVGVFLGFARSRPNMDGHNTCASNLFGNALSLLRFRMIETGVRFEFDIMEKQIQMKGHNTSILTMIFYLILSDVLTAVERKKLVTEKVSMNNFINGSFDFSLDSIKIELNTELVSFDEIEFNKLIPNLLNLEKLNLEIEKKLLYLKLR